MVNEIYTLEQLRQMNALDGNKKLIFVEQVEKILEWIQKEVNGLPTEIKTINFKTQVAGFIVPLAKKKLRGFRNGAV